MTDGLKKIHETLQKIEKTIIGTKEVLTVDEVSLYLGIKKPTLYQLTSERKIPHYKPSGRRAIYFKKSEIDQWLLRTRIDTADEIDHQAEQYTQTNPNPYNR